MARNSVMGLVTELMENGRITKQRVAQTMSKVDRAKYCPSSQPYEDCPYSIGYNATISAPHMHAIALEELDDKLVEGAKVLDVGSGSGYLTACMAHMVGPTGRVYGIEHIQQLVEKSIQNVKNDCPELIDSGRVTLLQGDGREGLKEHAPFDVIHVGACAGLMPENLISQLKRGGRMVLPVVDGANQVFKRVEKQQDDTLLIRQILLVRYVPLTTIKAQLDDR